MSDITIKTFEPIKVRFTELLDEKTFAKECSFAVQHLQKNSYLAKSTQESVLGAVLNLAQIGLTLNPALKLAYLVPRRVGNDVTCCLEPSYQGLCKLATDTGSVKNIYAHLVYENDVFRQILGTSNEIIHEPAIANRGDFMGCYAVGILADGRKQVEFMDKLSLYEIRDISESYKAFKEGKVKDCIWNKNEDEMCRKTVIKRLCKYLPKTEHWDRVAKAIELDNDDYAVSLTQLNMIEQLIKTSAMPEEKKNFVEGMMYTYTKEQANRVILQLQESQIDPVTHGGNFGQKAITEHKNKLA